ncbi:hypothetical protein [Nitrososphaera sp.]|uniref:hypothetical protein n=1 Tax=Nitrososphaera sp. TaxID=1971748 RepID=UPI00307F4E80
MPYYEIARLREITLGSATDASQDTLLNAKGAQADSQVDDELYIAANRHSRLQSLPALPLAGGMLTQSIRDAATDRAASLFFLAQRQPAMAEKYMESSNRAVQAFVMRLGSESEIYSENV